MRPILTIAAVLALCWACMGPALADGADAAVQVFVFHADGTPAAGVPVSAGGVTAVTGAGGSARLAVPAGRHRLLVGRDGAIAAAPAVRAVAGQLTEVLVRQAAPGGTARVDIEAPGGPDPETAQTPATPDDGPDEPVRTGTIQGTAKDAKSGTPVGRARVYVVNRRETAVTGEDGGFALSLPAGTYALRVYHADYGAWRADGVVVPPDGTVRVAPAMPPAVVRLPGLVKEGFGKENTVNWGARLTEESTKAITVLSGDIMNSAGTVDQVAKRAVGLTVVGGRYVYVRGMGERYSSTLLNGSTLPSPEPERRVVPLDIFPTGMIQSVIIHKTYSPELPGSFGGGTVYLQTRTIPKQFNLSVGISTGFLTGTTSHKGLTYDGGHNDWLGFDDGTRDLPGSVQSASEGQPIALFDPILQTGYPAADLERFGEAMPNVYSVEPTRINPDFGLNFAIGNKTTLFGKPFGFQVGMSYGNSWSTRRYQDGLIGTTGSGTRYLLNYHGKKTTNTINLAATSVLGWELTPSQKEDAPKNTLEMTTLAVRTTRNTADFYEGYIEVDGVAIRVNTLDWTEEQLISNQLRGEHTKLWQWLDVGWSYTFSMANRYQPDWRQTRYDFNDIRKTWQLSNRPEGNRRRYNQLDDFNHDVGLNASAPFTVWNELEARVEVGANVVLRNRESETRRFKFIHRGPDSQDPNVLELPRPEDIFVPAYIGPNGFSFEEITRATDQYEAEQYLYAGYVKLDLPIGYGVAVSAGARFEMSDQIVTTFNLFERGQNPIEANLQTSDLLPSINATWTFWRESMKLRAGYSRTLTRPDFRDLSEVPIDLVIGGGAFIGNADLEETHIDNFDLRWEWYPIKGEPDTVSAGVFYKNLTKPIETVIYGGANVVTSLSNADGATNIGFEFEFRKNLGFLADNWGWLPTDGVVDDHLRLLYISGNLALIDSQVDLAESGVATATKRPLQGQSEWVVNLGIGYNNPASGLSCSLHYNVFGERIVAIGAFGLSDALEQPFQQLDFIFGYQFSDHWKVGFKAKNLLNEHVEVTQDHREIDRYRKGVGFSLSLTWNF